MIKFENTEVLGWQAAIRGMRNPMNSWEKSDSFMCDVAHCNDSCKHRVGVGLICDNGNLPDGIQIGPNDLDLMNRLRHSGTDHRKFMRMITVYVDITAPLYFFKEFETYKVGTVSNSCSTMHKIHAKEFTLEDFSHEHLIDYELYSCDEVDGTVLNCAPDVYCGGLQHMNLTINVLNYYRKKYLETKDKKYWWQMIQLLPSSYNQKRTIMLNYEVLANIYKSRKNHKLDEWAAHSSSIPDSTSQALYSKDLPFGFCDWIKTLPYSELITGEHFLAHDEIMEKLDKWAKDAEREV